MVVDACEPERNAFAEVAQQDLQPRERIEHPLDVVRDRGTVASRVRAHQHVLGDAHPGEHAATLRDHHAEILAFERDEEGSFLALG